MRCASAQIIYCFEVPWLTSSQVELNDEMKHVHMHIRLYLSKYKTAKQHLVRLIYDKVKQRLEYLE